MPDKRRKIDQILDPDFVDGLEELDIDELRARRRLCDEAENELSYYRRMLHGRMDLLAFELRRRRGEETRSLLEALPEILSDHPGEGPPAGRPTRVTLPSIPDNRRRLIDRALEDDFLARLAFVEESELLEIQEQLVETEAEVSAQRQAVQQVFDAVQSELTRRYREGLASFDELLGRS